MKFANPDIQLEAGGEVLTIRFSALAQASLQDHWGLKNLDEAAAKIVQLETGGLNISDYAAIMWAALRTHHSEKTMDDAMKLIDFIGIPGLQVLLVQAVTASLPEGGDRAPANPPRPAARGQ